LKKIKFVPSNTSTGTGQNCTAKELTLNHAHIAKKEDAEAQIIQVPGRSWEKLPESSISES
jgi:hypothetical protein